METFNFTSREHFPVSAGKFQLNQTKLIGGRNQSRLTEREFCAEHNVQEMAMTFYGQSLFRIYDAN